ncbi:MAG: ferrochelatase [Bdellovibrionota bacterium]
MIFDAFFFVSFGGPDRPEDIAPFLDNVLRGKNVPAHRKKEVVEHYMRFGGKSPINEQNQHLIEKIKQAFARNKIDHFPSIGGTETGILI